MKLSLKLHIVAIKPKYKTIALQEMCNTENMRNKT